MHNVRLFQTCSLDLHDGIIPLMFKYDDCLATPALFFAVHVYSPLCIAVDDSIVSWLTFRAILETIMSYWLKIS